MKNFQAKGIIFLFSLLLLTVTCSHFNGSQNTPGPQMLDTIINMDTIANIQIKPYTPTAKTSGNLQELKLNLNASAKSDRFDTMFTSLHNTGFSGCVLVAQQGVILFEKCYGDSNIDTDSLTNNSIFQLASVSKTITATAALLLIDNNIIGLDSNINRYLPELPYHNITVRQLLTHRSGLPNYVYFTDETYFDRLDNDYMDNNELLTYLVECPPPINLQPDSRFVYCNTNYSLLASIIERVSHMKFSNFIATYIFTPLQMYSTFATTPWQFAQYKNATKGAYVNGKPIGDNYQDGIMGDKGIYSTVRDMFLFHTALSNGFISSTLIELAYSNAVTEPNRFKKYGLGWRIYEAGDKHHITSKIVYHNGWWHGYRTAFHRRLIDNSCVIVLGNNLCRNVYSCASNSFYILDNLSPKLEDDTTDSVLD